MPTYPILLRPASAPLSRKIAATLGAAFFVTLSLAYIGTAGLRDQQQALLMTPDAEGAGAVAAGQAPSLAASTGTTLPANGMADTRTGRSSAPPEHLPPGSFALKESAPGRYLPAGLAPLHAWAGYLNRHPDQRLLIHLHGPLGAAAWEERRRNAALLRLLSIYGVSVHRIRLGAPDHPAGLSGASDPTTARADAAAAEAEAAANAEAAKVGGVAVTLEIDRG